MKKHMNIIYDANILAQFFYKDKERNELYLTTESFLQELLKNYDANVYLYVKPQFYAEEFALSHQYPEAHFIHTFFSYSKAALAKIIAKLSIKKRFFFLINVIRFLFIIFDRKVSSFDVICRNADAFISFSPNLPSFVNKYNMKSYVFTTNPTECIEIVEKIKKQKSIENERLNIIYRICDMKNASSSTKRCFDVSKNTLIKKCLKSVKENIDNYQGLIHFYCIADNCSDDIINYLKRLVPNVSLKRYDKIGNAKSFCECINLACSLPNEEQVYFLEDDYLMLNNDVLNNINFNLKQISKEKKCHIAIMPDDYPDRYSGNAIKTECRVTETNHFLKINKSTCTFATYVDVIKKNKKFLLNFAKWPRVTESGSVNQVWKRVPLYQPIPAWTLHCQIRSVIPKYLDYNGIKNHLQDDSISNRNDTPKPL